MKNRIILGALFVGAFIAAVFYFKPEPANQPAPTVDTAPDEPASAAGVKPAKVTPRSRTSNSMPSAPRPAGASQVSQDPRLVTLEVSPEDGLIKFVRGPDTESSPKSTRIPNSLGFRKPKREYTYSDGKVVGLTSYRYYPDHVEVSRTAVSYKPDGSIDKYEESTTYDRAKVKSKDSR